MARKITKQELDESLLEELAPVSEGSFTDIMKAYPNTSYTVAQIRNIILSPNNAVENALKNIGKSHLLEK